MSAHDPLCECGHSAYWHSHGGAGDCEHDGDCKCEAFKLGGARMSAHDPLNLSTESEALMDKYGHIYELTGEDRAALNEPFKEQEDEEAKARLDELREDVARLDGYLRGRADSDAPKRSKGANKDLAG